MAAVARDEKFIFSGLVELQKDYVRSVATDDFADLSTCIVSSGCTKDFAFDKTASEQRKLQLCEVGVCRTRHPVIDSVLRKPASA
jgi:hypothetical protein